MKAVGEHQTKRESLKKLKFYRINFPLTYRKKEKNSIQNNNNWLFKQKITHFNINTYKIFPVRL